MVLVVVEGHRNQRRLESPLNAKKGQYGWFRCNGIGTTGRWAMSKGGPMANDTQVYREEFDTEGEAIAFTEGIDFVDSDHVSYESPFEENGKWIVEVKKFV
jgi:hypothetical protein